MKEKIKLYTIISLLILLVISVGLNGYTFYQISLVDSAIDNIDVKFFNFQKTIIEGFNLYRNSLERTNSSLRESEEENRRLGQLLEDIEATIKGIEGNQGELGELNWEAIERNIEAQRRLRELKDSIQQSN